MCGVLQRAGSESPITESISILDLHPIQHTRTPSHHCLLLAKNTCVCVLFPSATVINLNCCHRLECMDQGSTVSGCEG